MYEVGSDDEGLDGRQSSIATAFLNHDKLCRQRTSNPTAIIREFAEETKRELGARVGDRWTYPDKWEMVNYGANKNLGCLSRLMAEAVELYTRGEGDAACATQIEVK